MEYVIPAVLVVLLVGGFVTFMVLNATKKSGPAAKRDDAPGMGADDETPLGDTTQHAGEQTETGATVGAHGTSGAAPRQADPDAAAHVARPGEGEGAARLGFEGERPRAGGTDAPTPQRAGGGEEPAEEQREGAPERSGDDDEPTPPASERLADRDV